MNRAPDFEESTIHPTEQLGRVSEQVVTSLMDDAHDCEWGTANAPANPEKALKLYMKAAKLGAPSSWASIGNLYRWGEGCRQNDREALRWLRMGAEHGDRESLGYLAKAYATGELGLDPSPADANKCYRKYFRGLCAENMLVYHKLHVDRLAEYMDTLTSTGPDAEDMRVLEAYRTAFLKSAGEMTVSEAPERQHEFTRLLAIVGL